MLINRTLGSFSLSSGLCWFGPAGLQSVFLAVHIAECRTALSNIPSLSSVYGIVSSQSQSADVATVKELKEVQPYVEPIYSPPPQTEEKVPTTQLQRVIFFSMQCKW